MLRNWLKSLFTPKNTSGSRVARKTKGPTYFKPGLEVLEGREVPSASPFLTATAVSGTQVNLGWTSVSGSTSYLVDEWINGAWQQIGSTGSGSTGYAVSGLNPNTTYYFDVGAYSWTGVNWATYQGATTGANLTAPAAPSLSATAASGTQVNLTWNGVSGASNYLVDEWINGAWQQIGNLSSGSTSYAVSGLSPNTTYYFDVGASNAAGTAWANYQSVTTSAALTAPTAPSLTATAVSSSQINLAWNSVSGATSYMVDELINGSWQQIGSTGSSSTSYAVSGLNGSTSYYFLVGATNAAGTTWSDYQSATTGVKLAGIAAPTVTATAASSSQINLAWNGVSGATSYAVAELIGGTWKQITTVYNGGTSFSVSGLTSGTTYNFMVGATTAAGTVWSNSVSATTTGLKLAASAAPTLTATTASSSQINLTWNGVSGATSYVVQEWVNNSWQQIGSTGSGSTSYAVTGLDGSSMYSFRVGAANAAGTTLSNSVSATTSAKLTAPAAPTLTATTASSSQINLAWNGVSGATSYAVQEFVNGAWQQIGSTGSGSTSYAVTGLDGSNTYYFRVGAVNAAGTTMSNSVSAATSAKLTAPAALTITGITASTTQIDLAWSGGAGATSYVVDQWIGAGWQQIGSTDSGTTSYSVKGLNANTTYYFMVGAANAAGTTWANSFSATTSVALAAAPTLTATTSSSSQIDLAWNAVSGATSYVIQEFLSNAWQSIATLGSGSTSYQVTGLNASTSYTFRVGAANTAGTNWSSSATAITQESTNYFGGHVYARSFNPNVRFLVG